MLYPLTFLKRAEGKLVSIWQLYRVYWLLMKNSPLQGIFLYLPSSHSLSLIQPLKSLCFTLPASRISLANTTGHYHDDLFTTWALICSLQVHSMWKMTFKSLADSICCTKHTFGCLVLSRSWLGPCQTAGCNEHSLCGKVNGYNMSFLHLGECTARSQNYRKIKNSDGLIECLCEDAGALMISLWFILKEESVESNSHSTV